MFYKKKENVNQDLLIGIYDENTYCSIEGEISFVGDFLGPIRLPLEPCPLSSFLLPAEAMATVDRSAQALMHAEGIASLTCCGIPACSVRHLRPRV